MMVFFKQYLYIFFLVFLIGLTGCAENNSDVLVDSNEQELSFENLDDNTSTLILRNSQTTVTQNGEIINIELNVIDGLNNPSSSGGVKIIYPNDVREGRDIGSFESSVVDVVNGIANFVYTAPTHLDTNTSDIIFYFYHESRPTDSKQFTVKIAPDPDQITLTSYTLQSSINDKISMEIQSSKLVSFSVKDEDSISIADSDIVSITVTMSNPKLGSLEDYLGNNGSSLRIESKNGVEMNINSNKISGIIPINVDAIFRDVNGKNQTITEIFNILVLSGPPSAMSLSYIGSENIAERVKYIERWALTVTDKYNNLVDTKPAVSMGLIAGFTHSSPSSGSGQNYIYFEPSVGGTMEPINNDFTARKSVFAKVDDSNDVLVTFGDGYTYNASGKWDITTKSNTVLELLDDYDGISTTNLGFAVGHNYRQDTCQGGEAIANVYPENKNYIIDETGTMIINIEYDYYLVGKSVMLWVNMVGNQNNQGKTVRIGEAKKITLRALGLDAIVPAHTVAGIYTVPIQISGTVEWYRNARFSFTGVGPGVTVIGTSNSNITACNNAYIDVNVTDMNGTVGTISIENLLITNEF